MMHRKGGKDVTRNDRNAAPIAASNLGLDHDGPSAGADRDRTGERTEGENRPPSRSVPPVIAPMMPPVTAWLSAIRHRRIVPHPVVIAALVALWGIASAGWWLWFDRTRTLDDGARSARTLVHVLEEQTGRTIQAVDLNLVAIIDSLRTNLSLQARDPAFEDALRQRLKTQPYIRTLLIVGPDGSILQNSDRFELPPGALADREYFQAHARDPDPAPKIGRPLVSRTTGSWFFSVSRRITRPDGSFGGIVSAAVEPSYFQHFYRDLALGEHDSIGLFRTDGILLARIPLHREAFGEDVSKRDLFRLHWPKSPEGTYRTAHSFVDGVPRIVSYRAVSDFPLVVAVGLHEGDWLAPWRRTAVGIVVATSVMAILIILLALLWNQRRQDRERALQHQIQAQKLEALGRMTGGIAHDFNNLMAIVASGLTVIRHKVDCPQVRNVADVALGAVERGATLTGQMLAFARRQELKVATADVNALITAIEHLLRNAAGSRVRMVFDLDPQLPACWTDQTQFDTALLNLVVNARDAIPGDGEIRIATSSREGANREKADREKPGRGKESRPSAAACPAGHVCVSVRDSGQGMPPDVLRKALDPFFTTKGDKGTGLGLSQVYGFMRQIGGDLTIESAAGRGTTVHLLFPAGPGGDREAPSLPPSGHHPITSPPST